MCHLQVQLVALIFKECEESEEHAECYVQPRWRNLLLYVTSTLIQKPLMVIAQSLESAFGISSSFLPGYHQPVSRDLTPQTAVAAYERTLSLLQVIDRSAFIAKTSLGGDHCRCITDTCQV